MQNQYTIKKKIFFEGLGLHSGQLVKMILLPSGIDSGIYFKRNDINNSKPIKAIWNNTVKANLCTKISNRNGDTVSTIEHFMFALYAMGITNLSIEINGPEVPILDGSSKLFIDKILETGTINQNKEIAKLEILKSFEIKDENKLIKYEPTKNKFLEINYSISYDDQFIKKQSFLLKNAQKNYDQVSNCRTFCHQEDLEKIFAMGLAKGGSLENAIVISGNKILNQGGLRVKDEFVRHKILDCIGDLYLSGYFINGKISCFHGGHELTANLLKKIFSSKENYLLSDSKNFSQYNTSKKLPKNARIQAVV